MVTKLFNTAQSYAVAAIAPPAARFVQIDLATIAANTTVTFPASATVGQCIGLLLTSDNGGASSVTGAGPVDAEPFPLTFAGDSALFTWTGTLWRPVAERHAATFASSAYDNQIGATTSSVAPATLLTVNNIATPLNGYLQIDAALDVRLTGAAGRVLASLLVDGVGVRDLSLSLVVNGEGMLTFVERVQSTYSGVHSVEIQWSVSTVLATATNLVTTLRVFATLV